MTIDNRGYSLAITHGGSGATAEKVYLKPMSLYVPAIAHAAVAELINTLADKSESEKGFTLTVTNNNNGVSADKDFSRLAELEDATTAADTVKDLINIVRGYESDEETNVCGW
ncbi:DUF1869 domain-containing protein [Pseudescherichia sp.]|uniref:DUF1869 domain-containing protein n=1 Tax=Pseudescherichia sp. TaxID=2055881 RepID=UPI0028999E24|nr:DUF1869 domain-containing protein [Pseudescherichia sp.]